MLFAVFSSFHGVSASVLLTLSHFCPPFFFCLGKNPGRLFSAQTSAEFLKTPNFQNAKAVLYERTIFY
jgi:hypothetical protein